jgi:hypothetical protein
MQQRRREERRERQGHAVFPDTGFPGFDLSQEFLFYVPLYRPVTARKLQYLARVGGAYFRFDPRTQERQFSEMWKAMSVYVAGGEEAVRMTGGQAATLLLQHLKQEPMPIIEERARVRANSDIKE